MTFGILGSLVGRASQAARRSTARSVAGVEAPESVTGVYTTAGKDINVQTSPTPWWEATAARQADTPTPTTDSNPTNPSTTPWWEATTARQADTPTPTGSNPTNPFNSPASLIRGNPNGRPLTGEFQAKTYWTESQKQAWAHQTDTMLEQARAQGATPQQLSNIRQVLLGEGGRPSIGWKIHLPVRMDVADPLTGRIANWLDSRNPQYKVGSGGDEEFGTGMTIYVGSRDEMQRLAREIDAQFGDDLARTPYALERSDEHILGRITARFDSQHFRPEGFPPGRVKYKNYGNLLDEDAPLMMPHNTSQPGGLERYYQALARAHQERISDFGTFYTGTTRQDKG
ncbi:MAG: hypothetical protein VKJ04_04145 [Vampirovibrionales bacterium]|nr:hypothetical protein [Vampirovibrionales bacterium]